MSLLPIRSAPITAERWGFPLTGRSEEASPDLLVMMEFLKPPPPHPLKKEEEKKTRKRRQEKKEKKTQQIVFLCWFIIALRVKHRRLKVSETRRPRGPPFCARWRHEQKMGQRWQKVSKTLRAGFSRLFVGKEQTGVVVAAP